MMRKSRSEREIALSRLFYDYLLICYSKNARNIIKIYLTDTVSVLLIGFFFMSTNFVEILEIYFPIFDVINWQFCGLYLGASIPEAQRVITAKYSLQIARVASLLFNKY